MPAEIAACVEQSPDSSTEENVKLAHAFAMAAGDVLRGAESVPGDVVTGLMMVMEGLLRGPAQGGGK